MNQCQIQIFLDFKSAHNKECMWVLAEYDNKISTIAPQEETIFCYEESIVLPCSLTLTFDGKTLGQDTVVDQQGDIIRDKCVIITDIKLDGLSIEPLYLVKHIELKNKTESNYSNYIGFNGKMVLDFDYSNVFNQLMYFKRLGQN